MNWHQGSTDEKYASNGIIFRSWRCGWCKRSAITLGDNPPSECCCKAVKR